MKTKIALIITTIGILAAGCEPATKNIDTINDDGKPVMGLDYRDFDRAASEMIQSLLSSGSLKKNDGSRYVVATGLVTNDTMQRIDSDQLMAKIEEELLNSGQVVMTSAIGGKGAPDKMIYDARDLRNSEEFDQNTVAARNTLLAPELSISGKIFQRNIRYDNDKQQIEYYFQLKVSDVKSGLRFWQKETVIGKRGSNKSVAW